MAVEDGRLGRVKDIQNKVGTKLNNLEVRVGDLDATMQPQFYWILAGFFMSVPVSSRPPTMLKGREVPGL